MRFDGLDAWLDWQLGLHPQPIEPGLERVERVARRTGWSPPDCPVVHSSPSIMSVCFG